MIFKIITVLFITLSNIDYSQITVFKCTRFSKPRQASLCSMIALSIFLGLSLEGLAQNLTISSASTSNVTFSTSGTGDRTYRLINTSSPAVLNVTDITTQLNSGIGVTIVAPGTITVTSGISAGGSNMLTFKATNKITLSSGTGSSDYRRLQTNNGDITLWANSADSTSGGMQKLDFGYGYEMGQRTSSTALRANTHELFLRFKFGHSKANNQTQKEENNAKQ